MVFQPLQLHQYIVLLWFWWSWNIVGNGSWRHGGGGWGDTSTLVWSCVCYLFSPWAVVDVWLLVHQVPCNQVCMIFSCSRGTPEKDHPPFYDPCFWNLSVHSSIVMDPWPDHPSLRPLFLKPFCSYFHGNEPLTRPPLLKATLSETFLFIFPW